VKKHCAGVPRDPYMWIDNFVHATTVSSLGNNLGEKSAVGQCRRILNINHNLTNKIHNFSKLTNCSQIALVFLYDFNFYINSLQTVITT